MKQLILFLLMVLTPTYSFCQNSFWDLTKEDRTWNEETRDKAYIAPNSKFVGKKWYVGPACYRIFNTNGTYKDITNYTDTLANFDYVLSESGTWKRNKQYITISKNPKLTTYTPKASSLSRFSARKKDEIIQNLKKLQATERSWTLRPKTYEIFKINNDVFILYDNYDNPYLDSNRHFIYFYSEKKLNEILDKLKSE